MSQLNPNEGYDPTHCLNCGHTNAATDEYCSTCSQRNRAPARSVGEWLAEAFTSFFHLDGKAWTSIRDLFIPGRYARNYIAGRRQRYIHPLRLLLFSSLVFFAVASLERGNDFIVVNEGSARVDQPEERPVKYAIHEFTEGLREGILEDPNAPRALDSIRRSVDSLLRLAEAEGDEQQVTELEALDDQLEEAEDTIDKASESQADTGVLARMRYVDVLRMEVVMHDRVQQLRDSLLASKYANDSGALAVLDTFSRTFAMPVRWISDSGANGSNNTLLYDEHLDVPVRVVAAGSPADVVAASGLEHWENRLVVRKGATLIQQGIDSLSEYLWSSLSWGVLLYVPLLALGYRLFYWRRMPYYAHSLVYAAILMAVTLLAAALAILLAPWSVVPAIAIAVATAAYLLVGESVVYGVPLWKVVIKQLAMGWYAVTAFAFAMFLWLAVAMIFA